MNKYRFRGKSIETREWMYGFYLQRWTGTMYKHYICNSLFEYEVDPETVGLDMNVPDKNNTHIFEGDLIKVIDSEFQREHIGVATFIMGKLMICWQDETGHINRHICGTIDNFQDMNMSCSISYTYEIVGNIYDN